MKPAASLYAEGKLLTTPLVADPSITLIENGPDHFGILLARGCTQSSWGNALFLNEATWFRASAKDFKISAYKKICLSEKDGLCAASDTDSVNVFPIPSRVPYVTLFLPGETYEHLHKFLDHGKGSQLFRFVQKNFGPLPGFKAMGNGLETPKGYAEARQASLPMLE